MPGQFQNKEPSELTRAEVWLRLYAAASEGLLDPRVAAQDADLRLAEFEKRFDYKTDKPDEEVIDESSDFFN